MLYDQLTRRLFNFVYNEVRRKDMTKEILQDIFISLWNNRKNLNIATTLDACVFGAAKNKILTYVRSGTITQALRHLCACVGEVL